jgi:hypothetical protein
VEFLKYLFEQIPEPWRPAVAFTLLVLYVVTKYRSYRKDKKIEALLAAIVAKLNLDVPALEVICHAPLPLTQAKLAREAMDRHLGRPTEREIGPYPGMEAMSSTPLARKVVNWIF